MRTRSQARFQSSTEKGVDSTSLIDGARSKRAEVGDDFTVLTDGARSKRRKVQTSTAFSDEKAAHHCLPEPQTKDQLCAKSPPCRGDHIKRKASEESNRKGALQSEKHSLMPSAVDLPKSCHFVTERSSDAQGNAFQAHQEQHHLDQDDSLQHNDAIEQGDEIHIEEPEITLQELENPQKQAEKDNISEDFPLPTQEKQGKHLQISCGKMRGTLFQSDRAHSGSNQAHVCPSAEQKKQIRTCRRLKAFPMPQKLKSLSLQRVNAAKLRWKHLGQIILNRRIPPATNSASEKLQAPLCEDIFNLEGQPDYCQSNDSQSLRKKRKTRGGHDFLLIASQRRPVARRQQRKLGQQQSRLLMRMKTWLIQAKFSQITKDETSKGGEEAFILTQDQRNEFVQAMVKSCQCNPKMRTLFLESVRILTMSGLMHAAASRVLQEESCEQAQNVMSAWADLQEKQGAATKGLTLNLLNAVNQLHETRGDLSLKLNTSENSYQLKQLNETTWKFTLPNLPMEEKSSLPTINGNLRQVRE